jgi:hypothetical protein
VQDRNTGKTIEVGHESHGLYYLSAPTLPIACSAIESPLVIHQRLGHPSLQKLHLMVPSLSKVSTLECESCQFGKHTRSSFPDRANKRAISPFAFVILIFGALVVLFHLWVINILLPLLTIFLETLGYF